MQTDAVNIIVFRDFPKLYVYTEYLLGCESCSSARELFLLPLFQNPSDLRFYPVQFRAA